jgi:hypothetical protein
VANANTAIVARLSIHLNTRFGRQFVNRIHYVHTGPRHYLSMPLSDFPSPFEDETVLVTADALTVAGALSGLGEVSSLAWNMGSRDKNDHRVYGADRSKGAWSADFSWTSLLPINV